MKTAEMTREPSQQPISPSAEHYAAAKRLEASLRRIEAFKPHAFAALVRGQLKRKERMS
jgi:hypothetical protein